MKLSRVAPRDVTTCCYLFLSFLLYSLRLYLPSHLLLIEPLHSPHLSLSSLTLFNSSRSPTLPRVVPLGRNLKPRTKLPLVIPNFPEFTSQGLERIEKLTERE